MFLNFDQKNLKLTIIPITDNNIIKYFLLILAGLKLCDYNSNFFEIFIHPIKWWRF